MKNFVSGLLLLLISFASIAQFPVRSEKAYILIDDDGDQYTKETFDFIGDRQSSTFIAVRDGYFGYINTSGKTIINPQYDIAYPFIGSFALVGKDGKYFHINKQNEVFHTISWAMKPMVCNKDFLLIPNADSSDIYFKDGTKVFSSPDSLILSLHSGLLEYDPDSSLIRSLWCQAYRKVVFVRNAYEGVDSVFYTSQGYVGFIRSEKKGRKLYLFNTSGTAELLGPADNVDLRKIYVNSYTYVPSIYDQAEHLAGMYQDRVFWDMSKMVIPGSSYFTRLPYSFLIDDDFGNSKMVRLKGTEKWIEFSGQRVHGNMMFDDVGKGSRHYLPLKIGELWFIKHKPTDSLIPTGFRYIHPIGMNRSAYFGSNDNNYNRKWAIVNVQTGYRSEELYTLVPNNILFSNAIYYEAQPPSKWIWKGKFVRVKKDDEFFILNLKGEEIWQEPETDPLKIEDFIIDHFHMKAKQKKLGKKEGKEFTKNILSAHIRYENGRHYVYIVNRSKESMDIDVQDGIYPVSIQRRATSGKWKDISYVNPSFCGNSYYKSNLSASSYVKYPLPVYRGRMKRELRVVLRPDDSDPTRIIVSNSIWVTLNPAKTWVLQYHHPYGAAFNHKWYWLK